MRIDVLFSVEFNDFPTAVKVLSIDIMRMQMDSLVNVNKERSLAAHELLIITRVWSQARVYLKKQ